MTAKTPTLPTAEELLPVAKKFGVRLVVLFGSAARGKTHAESDIDVGVLMERVPTFNQRLKLWQALCELFQAEIDLAILNHAEPVFGSEVARDGKLLFESEKFAWENWRAYKIHQFWDTKKFRDDLERYIARCAEEIAYA